MGANVVAIAGSASAILVALGIGLAARMSHQPARALRAVVRGFLGLNGLGVLVCLIVTMVALARPMAVFAQGSAVGVSGDVAKAAGLIGAALSTGLACIGAGIAVAVAGAAAIGSITEKPEILGRTLIFVGLAEGIAIYGLIISFMILNQ